jgi:hypothetical protein
VKQAEPVKNENPVKSADVGKRKWSK